MFHPDSDEGKAYDSLMSTVCPFCKGAKFARQTFCLKDYRKLPKPMQNALYRKIGDGYMEAFDEAMCELDSQKEKIPEVLFQ